MNQTERNKGAIRRLFQAGVSVAFLCLVAITSSNAETISTASLKKGYSTAELDQMLAPIALYPDGLLLQVLMASTYPAEVVDAGKWLETNPGLSGDDAVEVAEDYDWNVSVRSLLAFPDVLFTMSSNMGWTVKLGTAFRNQREDVMERVQYLRRQARAAGNLDSDERMNVVRNGNDIAIEPVSPEVIYVPYYNPTVIYGSWHWPGYAPYYWAPWRGYAYAPGHLSIGFMWGNAISFSYTRFYGWVDWHRRHVHWVPPRHPAPRHTRPAHHSRPVSSHARPDHRPGKNSPYQARPTVKQGNHARPGNAKPKQSRPSSPVASRPQNHAKQAVNPPREAQTHPAARTQPAHNMVQNRPSAIRPNNGAVHSRPSQVSSSAVRPSSGAGRAASSAHVTLRETMQKHASASHQSSPRFSAGASARSNGQRGGSRR